MRINGTLTRDERYLYRGYLRIATLDALNGDALVHAILWDPSEPEATRPLGLTTSDGIHYSYGHDFTKNVTEMLDETGRLVASYEYDPYGRTIIESGSCAHANPLGFSSEITDRETGIMYYNYRDYNPTDGRWLTRDPIGEQGGRNLYRFAGNNSLNRWNVYSLTLPIPTPEYLILMPNGEYTSPGTPLARQPEQLIKSIDP